MAKAITLFNDWLTSTNETVLTGPQEIISEVAKQTYILSDMLKGKGDAQTVRGGNAITDRLQVTDATQFAFYQPNQTFTPIIEDVLQKISAPWRFAHNMWAYTDQEIELNSGGGAASQLVQFKDLKFSKEQAAKVDTFNKMEEAIWAAHSDTTMETVTGTNPYGIRSFITDDGNAGSGSTLCMGLNPTTYTKWKNQTGNYTIASIDTTVIPAFDDMWRKVDFQAPTAGEAGGAFTGTNYDKFKIYTDLAGIKKYVQVTRDSNDRLMTPTDPGTYNGRGGTGGVSFNGIAVKYAKGMQELAFGNTKYYFVNTEFLFPIFHTTRYFASLEPMRSPNQPYTWVVHQDTWYNLFCRSRQRQGVITGA